MKTLTLAFSVAVLLGGMAFADDAAIPVTSFGGYFNTGEIINHSSDGTAFNNWSHDFWGWGSYAEGKITTKATNWGFFLQPLYNTNDGNNSISLYESFAWAMPTEGFKIEIGTGNDTGIQDLDDNAPNNFNKAEGITFDLNNGVFELAVIFNGWGSDMTNGGVNVNSSAPYPATLMAGVRWTDKNFTLNVYGGTTNNTNPNSTFNTSEDPSFDQLYATFSPNLPSFLSAWSLSLGYDVGHGLLQSGTRSDLADLSISFNVNSFLTIGVIGYGYNLTNNVQNSDTSMGAAYTARYFSYRPNLSLTIIPDSSGEHPVFAVGAYFLGDTSKTPDYQPAVTAQWTMAPGATLNLKAYYDTNTTGPNANAVNFIYNLPATSSGVFSFASDFVYSF